MKRTYFFILNPESNHGKSKKYFKYLKKILESKRIEYNYKETNSLQDAYLFSKEANEKRYEIIIAVGGDGTINKVINGFYNENGKRISKAKLGVIHTGTSPDFCKSYGIPNEPFTALNTIFKNYSKKISIAQIEYQDEKNVRKNGYFACCASLGLGSTVARNANSGIRRYLGDFTGTFISIIKALLLYKASNLFVKLDGKQTIIKQNFNTFIGKTSFIASGIKIHNDLSINDKCLYLLSLKNITWKNVTSGLKSIYSAKPIHSNDIVIFDYANTIEIYKNNINPEIEFDGDPQGFLPCKISIAEDLLEIIVTQETE
ncbi:MAG: diacylglycerol kinase [Candidatus Cloacimonetes bacterium]|nr:diacylglycerol kinase [Candidatus Cloacimonadota bacterium]